MSAVATDVPTRPSSEVEERVTLRQWIAVSGAIIGSFCAVLNHQITNTSLREIQAALSANLTEASWITTAYLAAAIVIMPLTAWFTRVFSIRTYATVNTAGFMLSLVACALAWDLNAMIALRFIAGLFGGGLMPMAFNRHPRDAAPVEAARRLHVVGPADGPGADRGTCPRRLADGHVFVGTDLLRPDHPGGNYPRLLALRPRPVAPVARTPAPDPVVQHRVHGGRTVSVHHGARGRQPQRLVHVRSHPAAVGDLRPVPLRLHHGPAVQEGAVHKPAPCAGGATSGSAASSSSPSGSACTGRWSSSPST